MAYICSLVIRTIGTVLLAISVLCIIYLFVVTLEHCSFSESNSDLVVANILVTNVLVA